MRKTIAIGLLLGAGACSSGSDYEIRADRPSQLTRMLEGREAGPPVRCVNQRDLRGTRSADGAIVFDGPRNTLYVNRPAGGCPSLDFGRVLVTRSATGRLCSGDIARVVDPLTRSMHGSCGLSEFTPWRRPRA